MFLKGNLQEPLLMICHMSGTVFFNLNSCALSGRFGRGLHGERQWVRDLVRIWLCWRATVRRREPSGRMMWGVSSLFLPGWASVPGRYRQPRRSTSPKAIKVLGGSLCNVRRGLWCGSWLSFRSLPHCCSFMTWFSTNWLFFFYSIATVRWLTLFQIWGCFVFQCLTSFQELISFCPISSTVVSECFIKATWRGRIHTVTTLPVAFFIERSARWLPCQSKTQATMWWNPVSKATPVSTLYWEVTWISIACS